MLTRRTRWDFPPRDGFGVSDHVVLRCAESVGCPGWAAVVLVNALQTRSIKAEARATRDPREPRCRAPAVDGVNCMLAAASVVCLPWPRRHRESSVPRVVLASGAT